MSPNRRGLHQNQDGSELLSPPFGRSARFGRPSDSASPTNQAMRLLADGLSGKELMGGWGPAFAVIGAWAVAGYGLLLRSLSRRET